VQTVKLTKEQHDYFNTFGFLKFPGLFKDNIASITEEFELTFPTFRQDHKEYKEHDGKKRSVVPYFIDWREKLSALLDDPRIDGILTSLLGDDYNYLGSDGNYYVGDTPWHRDGYYLKYLNVKIAFYLDVLDGPTGALRVIPGSHKVEDQFGKDIVKAGKCEEVWGIHGSEVPSIALDIVPGDMLIFNHNTYHSSWGGDHQRRMFTINACQRYEEQDIQQLKDLISGASRFWLEKFYGTKMIETATPQRMIHLEQVMANDGHLLELSRKARQEMSEPARF
jgi:hypothetical protein